MDLKGQLDSSEWAKKLKMLREENGWSQRDVAERLGVHPQTISEIERGKEGLTLERLNRLLDALGYSSKVVISQEKPTTHSNWGHIESKEPDKRRLVKNAREQAERLARELYTKFDVDEVYCVGSLARFHGKNFKAGSDIDLVIEGLEGSDLISAKSHLEINLMEPPEDGQDFSFDLQRAENFGGSLDEMVQENKAVPIRNE